MLDKNSFKALLHYLNFTETKGIFEKKFKHNDAYLKVDFKNEKLIFPTDKGLIVHSAQTCNFSQNENFVVFECVHRLLEKGYLPKHIELEPKWALGHGQKGGRADILVRNYESKALLIIECKTFGKEFEKAWNKTKIDGGQLFTYVQQITETEYLCLYASNFKPANEKKKQAANIALQQQIISHKDNPKILERQSQTDNYLSFETASNLEQRFQVWKEIYQLESTQSGIFEANVQTYQIGKYKYTLKDDTKPVTAFDKKGKYHQFRTILRKYNIARRETAFEVLVNLFLCKIVDEQRNAKDLKFYWKGIAYDDYFSFVDRLQELYTIGMEEFLNEKISYVSEKEIDEAFWAVKNDRNATKKKIQQHFRELKFFSNNAFSFINVHNERLFNKNAKVLLEIVGMWQHLRLKTKEQNQFLGDLFEYFLDTSIKQSEGQFFTPMPICKFIVSSLPLAQQVEYSKTTLRAIDYACGSGHFLNEYAYQIKYIVQDDENLDVNDFYKNTFGIEKEDRLTKVAKVAAFMYGQNDINIIDRDALEDIEHIEKESFDVLVANPPFAVEGFLENLSNKAKNSFSLIKTTGYDSNTDHIQCFFIEKAKQLLAPNGITGLIVPATILNNTDKTHIRTREILLQYFNTVAIVELGSHTFGKTGTNTVILFLQRKYERPEPAEHYYNRILDFFEGIDSKHDIQTDIYRDWHIVKAYCQHIDIDINDYETLLNAKRDNNKNILPKLCDTYEMFEVYKNAFDKSTEIKKLKTQTHKKQLRDLPKKITTWLTKKYKTENLKKTDKEIELEKTALLPQKKSELIGKQQKVLHDKLLDYILTAEKDKLYYFVLAYTNKQKVLLVKSPSQNAEQKKFLGYEWRKTKRKEGMVYHGGDTVHNIITPLFDPKDTQNTEKINYYIQQNFLGNTFNELPQYCSYANLVDMLDFKRTSFDKSFSLSPKQKNIAIETKWPLVKLKEIVENLGGLWKGKKAPFITVNVIRNTNFKAGGILDLSNVAILEVEEKQYAKRKLQYGDIIVEKSGGSETQAIGRVVFFDKKEGEYSYSNFTTRIKVKSDDFLAKYLHLFLNYFYELGHIFNFQSGMSGIKNLDFQQYLNINIPKPNKNIQEQIVAACHAIDTQTATAQSNIVAIETKLIEKIQLLFAEGKSQKLSQLVHINRHTTNPKSRPLQSFTYIDIDSVGKGTGTINAVKKMLGKDAPSRARRVGHKHNIIISTVRPYLKGFAYLNEEMKDCIFSTGFAILESQDTDILLNRTLYYAFMYYHDLMQQMESVMKKAAYPSIKKSDIEHFRIPVPPLALQRNLTKEIDDLEQQIIAAKSMIAKATEKKQAIMRKYL